MNEQNNAIFTAQLINYVNKGEAPAREGTAPR